MQSKLTIIRDTREHTTSYDFASYPDVVVETATLETGDFGLFGFTDRQVGNYRIIDGKVDKRAQQWPLLPTNITTTGCEHQGKHHSNETSICEKWPRDLSRGFRSDELGGACGFPPFWPTVGQELYVLNNSKFRKGKPWKPTHKVKVKWWGKTHIHSMKTSTVKTQTSW